MKSGFKCSVLNFKMNRTIKFECIFSLEPFLESLLDVRVIQAIKVSCHNKIKIFSDLQNCTLHELNQVYVHNTQEEQNNEREQEELHTEMETKLGHGTHTFL